MSNYKDCSLLLGRLNLERLKGRKTDWEKKNKEGGESRVGTVRRIEEEKQMLRILPLVVFLSWSSWGWTRWPEGPFQLYDSMKLQITFIESISAAFPTFLENHWSCTYKSTCGKGNEHHSTGKSPQSPKRNSEEWCHRIQASISFFHFFQSLSVIYFPGVALICR